MNDNSLLIGTGSNDLICLQLLYLVLKYTIISAIRDCFKRIILTWWIALRFVFVTLYLYIISQSCDKYTFWSIIFQLYELINELIRSQQGGWFCDFLTSTWIEFLRSSVFNGRPCTDSDREFLNNISPPRDSILMSVDDHLNLTLWKMRKAPQLDKVVCYELPSTFLVKFENFLYNNF